MAHAVLQENDGGHLCYHNRMMKKHKVKKIIFSIFWVSIIYILLTTASICIYSTRDEKQNADAAIILGASASESGVSPVYRERLNHGIWLYENGYVEAMIVTGGVAAGNTMSDASIAKQYLVQQGIPEKDIYLEELSTITQENLFYAKEIMDANAFENAIIVSDPLHMKRAMLMAFDCGIEAYSSPTPTSMYRSLKTKIPFLCREEFFYVGYRAYRLFH